MINLTFQLLELRAVSESIFSYLASCSEPINGLRTKHHISNLGNVNQHRAQNSSAART